MIKNLKDTISLTKVIKAETGIQLKPNGYNTCPVCKGIGKLSVTEDKRVKCFRTTCVLNRTQDVFGLLMILGKASNFKESLQIASQYGDIDRATEEIKQSRTRSQCLEEVYKLYRNELYKSDYLESRGLKRSPLLCKVGFAPPVSKFLVNSQLSFSPITLYENGLIDAHENDFMFNRIVFPICSVFGEFVHLHGRAINPDSPLRWKCTSTLDGKFKSNMNYTYNIEQCKNDEVIFLTEGVTDGLTLTELGLPTVSCFGLKPALINEINELTNLKDIVAVFDNDRHELNAQNNRNQLYKSWPKVLPYLVELKLAKPEVNIWCVSPPADLGVKDLNEWLLNGLTLSIFEDYCKKNMVSLWEWYLKVFGVKGSHVLNLLPYLTSIEREKFKKQIDTLYTDWIDYITDFLLKEKP